MELLGVEQAIDELERTHQNPFVRKGLELIAALREVEGPTKYITADPYFGLTFWHANPRTAPTSLYHQVHVCIRAPREGLVVSYTLPYESHPWSTVKGGAGSIEDAVAMILTAFQLCESREEHLGPFETTER